MRHEDLNGYILTYKPNIGVDATVAGNVAVAILEGLATADHPAHDKKNIISGVTLGGDHVAAPKTDRSAL